MPSPLRARALRTLAAVMLLVALLVPGSAPALAADGEPLVLRAGTDQDLQVLNPWNSVVVADFEVFTLNYDTLVGFGQNIEPVAGFAESWEQSEDGLTWTFHIRPDMLWSDGEPATAEDARWTYQLVLDGQETENGYLGEGYLDGYLTNAGVTVGRGARCRDARRHHRIREHAVAPGLRADPSEAHLEPVHDRADRRRDRRGLLPEQPAGRRDRPVRGRRVAARRVHPLRPQRELLGRAGCCRRGDHPALRERRTPWSRPCGPARSTTSAASRPTSSTRCRVSRTSSPSRASPTATPSSRSIPGGNKEGYGGSTVGPVRPGVP